MALPFTLIGAVIGSRLNLLLSEHYLQLVMVVLLPVLAAETGEILVALRLRGDHKTTWMTTVRNLPYVAKPLLARCLRRSQTLALSVVSRGFFLATAGRVQAWAARERAACALLALVTVAVVAGKVLYLLAEQGLYFGVFRYVYDVAKLYL